MRSASVADWVLRCVAGREQAASMVGDLVEISRHKGMAWFWLSVAGIVAARTWRTALGLVIASYFGFWIGFKLWSELFAYRAGHRPPEFWTPAMMVVVLIGSELCWATIYSAIRFGIRDQFVQSLFAVVAVCIGLVYGWWQPVVFGCCIAGFAGIVAVWVMSRERRRAALTLPLVVMTGYFSVYLAGFPFLIHRYLSNLEFAKSIGISGYSAHPSWAVFYVQRAIQTLAIAAVCEIMRRWSMSTHKKDSALKDGELSPGIF